MNKIDVTKPLELDDGTPVTFDRISESKRAVAVRLPAEGASVFQDNYPCRGGGWYYDLATGFFGGAKNGKIYKTLRNRVPAVDPSKPMELEDGTPVKLYHLDLKLGKVVVTILEQPSRWDRQNWLYSLKTGEFITHKKVNQLRLRNCVQETSKLDCDLASGER